MLRTKSSNQNSTEKCKSGEGSSYQSSQSRQDVVQASNASVCMGNTVNTVDLSEVIMCLESLEAAYDQSSGYFDKNKGEFVWSYDFEPSLSTVSEEELEEQPTRYILLPDRYEINEYHMMKVFACDHNDCNNRLVRAITGRGAFRRFRETVEELGLLEEWYKFRDACYHERAVDWCHENGLNFTEQHNVNTGSGHSNRKNHKPHKPVTAVK